jgi:hypothetical protein
LYYTPYCVYCSTMSHTYLSVARYFQSNHQLSIARIDGMQNDLPVQYSVNTYPTIIFYPAHSKSNSVVYPRHSDKSAPSLIRFILSHIHHSALIRTALSRCSHHCLHSYVRTLGSRLVNLTHCTHRLTHRLTRLVSLLKHLTQQLSDDYQLSAAFETIRDSIISRDVWDGEESAGVELLRAIQGVTERIDRVRRRLEQTHAQRSLAVYLYRVLRAAAQSSGYSRERYLSGHHVVSLIDHYTRLYRLRVHRHRRVVVPHGIHS